MNGSETKPGIYTTEFWVLVLTNIAVVTSAATGVLPPKWAALVGAVSTAAYAIARGLAKLGVKPGAES